MNYADDIHASKTLDCREAEHMIPGYLEDTLSDRNMRAFIAHVQNCQKCYNELETNFMVERTVRYLNDANAENMSLNMQPLLRQDLREKIRSLSVKRRVRLIRGIILALTFILLALLILDLTGLFQITYLFLD